MWVSEILQFHFNQSTLSFLSTRSQIRFIGVANCLVWSHASRGCSPQGLIPSLFRFFFHFCHAPDNGNGNSKSARPIGASCGWASVTARVGGGAEGAGVLPSVTRAWPPCSRQRRTRAAAPQARTLAHKLLMHPTIPHPPPAMYAIHLLFYLRVRIMNSYLYFPAS